MHRMETKDLYAELGLPRSCSHEDIKKAYKKLALQWHPDKNQDRIEESTKKFQKISEAYAILSDEKKRARYDKFGAVDENDFNFEDFMNEFDFTDIFGAMFDMSMMMELMGMAMKPGKMNGRRMKNLEKKMMKKYEAQTQKMFEQMSKEAFGMFDDDDFDDDFDLGFGGFGGNKGKKKAKSSSNNKGKDGDDEWETEEEITDEEEDNSNWSDDKENYPKSKTKAAKNGQMHKWPEDKHSIQYYN